MPQGRENEILENLQCQLELANKEKDEAVKMCRDTIQQLDRYVSIKFLFSALS